MFKKVLSSVISLFVLASILITPEMVLAAPTLPITATSAVLIDAKTNTLIYSKNRSVKRAPASTTKLLTAIIAYERLKPNQVITVPKFAEAIQPSKLGMRAGEQFYAKDLIKAILTKSANDAAEVLGHAVAGSRAKFSVVMNEKARSIGAKNSHFVRASGLPAKGQYSTAYDMALIMRYAQRYPDLVQILKIKKGSIKSLGGRTFYLKNHNKMLWKDPREVLGKTGWTRKARYCFAGFIRVGKSKVFISMLGSHKMWTDLKKLVDFRFGQKLSKAKTNQKIWGITETRKIQKALKKAGYNPGSLDGQFGPKTVYAVTKFQQSKGLTADGIVGKRTYAKLKPYL